MEKQDLINSLAHNEELLKKLYKLYSQKYDKYSDFWNRLSDDERTHAEKIISFSEDEDVRVNVKKIPEKEIKNLAVSVEEAINELEENVPEVEKALKKALGFENMLAEKDYFSVFESDSDLINFYLQEMNDSVEQHRDRIRKMIEKL